MTQGRAPRPTDWTREEKNTLKTMLEGGSSYDQCAAALPKRTRTACRKRAFIMDLKSSHEDDQWRVVDWTPEVDAEIERLWLMNMQHSEIAEELGIPIGHVHGRVTELELPKRFGAHTHTVSAATKLKIRARSMRSIFRGDRRVVDGQEAGPESPNKQLTRPKLPPGKTETIEEFFARGGVVVRGEAACCAPINSGKGFLQFSVMPS